MEEKANEPGFKTWMAALDDYMWKRCGVGPDDVEDYHWHEHFEGGLSPQEAYDAFREDYLERAAN